MAQIKIKKDSELKPPVIEIPLTNTSIEEVGDDYIFNQQKVRQTLVHGILAPLIRVNRITVDIENIIYFSLKSINRLPSVELIIKDKYNFISELDTPKLDNELVVLILPKFDNAYKKINLMFYIADLKINNYNKTIQIKGQYKSEKLISSNIKSFGELSTYKLFENISNETKLGFATNIENNDEDKRYIYCDYKSYKDILDREITCGGTKEQVLDYWVDFWNNINLVDIKERYEAVDLDEDMKIWVSGLKKYVEENDKIIPVETVAMLNNNPALKSTELYVSNYKINNNTGAHIYSSGTDKLYSTYEDLKEEYVDYLVLDGDVKKDIYTKFEYMGEVYGKYNYLLSSRKRDMFFKKINSETIEITLNTPLLGIQRGHKVNFMWYTNNSITDEKINNLKKENLINEKISSNINIESKEELKDYGHGKFSIDKSISGQYLIIGCDVKFENHNWKYIVTLTRPIKDKPNILKEIE